MRYRYRNKVTGAEIETNCEISAPNYEKVGADAPIMPVEDPVDPAPEIPEPIEEEDDDMAGFDDIIKPDEPTEKPKAAKKSAKKPAKKGAKK